MKLNLQEQRHNELLLISTLISQIQNRLREREPMLCGQGIDDATIRILGNIAADAIERYWDSGLVDKQVAEEWERINSQKPQEQMP